MHALLRIGAMCGLLAWATVATGQAPSPAGRECVDGQAGARTEPAGPPRKAEGKSGTTGWSGALGGANIATEGGGTRDSKRHEAAKGLDPKPDGSKPPC
jgi:hypothetical protein